MNFESKHAIEITSIPTDHVGTRSSVVESLYMKRNSRNAIALFLSLIGCNAILAKSVECPLETEKVLVTQGENERSWQIGGKIHFEEKSGSDYLGSKEINKITKATLKEFLEIASDSCAHNAKILLKKDNNKIIMTHYMEKSRPQIGEELHATLLYTSPRGFCESETLKQVCSSLFENCKVAPSLEDVARAYYKVFSTEMRFKISEIIFTKNGSNGFFIIAKLLFDGRENIYKSGKPISAGLHMTLVNAQLFNEEIGKQIVTKLNEALQNKFVKIATKSGSIDLEFGISGSSQRMRALKPINHTEDQIARRVDAVYTQIENLRLNQELYDEQNFHGEPDTCIEIKKF